MKRKTQEKVSTPSVDRRLRYVRTSTRRLNEVANVVLLLQALADRERTYIHTESDRELFAIWRDSINHVRWHLIIRSNAH